MSKDPAALVYIAQWISATNGMKAEFRAWYFDLLLHQFDNGSVPKDLDEMAGICRVRPSEFERFNQFVNQVVDQKFNQNDNQRLENDFAKDVIQKRKSYKKGKDRSSAMGVVVRYALEFKDIKQTTIDKLKKHLYNLDTEEIIELKDKEKLKKLVDQMVNQKVDLLINKDIDIDTIEVKDEIIVSSKKSNNDNPELKLPFTSKEFLAQWDLWKLFRKKNDKFRFLNIDSENRKLKELENLSRGNEKTAIHIIQQSIDNGWKGLFELKKQKETKKSFATNR